MADMTITDEMVDRLDAELSYEPDPAKRKTILTAALAQAPTGVKALEWEEIPNTLSKRAKTSIGDYYVTMLRDGRYEICDPSLCHLEDCDEPAAITWCQADYEARILSALSSPAQEMPVTERESAWAALRMIADCVGNCFGPVANLESEEASLRRGPEYHHFAEGIVEALLRVSSPAQGQREGACLGFVNVYRHEDGSPVLGSTDLDDDPSEPAYAAEYCEFIGKAKVVLAASPKEEDDGE